MADEPAIKISETNPGESLPERSAVELSTKLTFRLSVKNTRALVIEAVKAARQIPLIDQDYIIARIAAIPEEHNLIRLDLMANPHKAGFNIAFTVCEI